MGRRPLEVFSGGYHQWFAASSTFTKGRIETSWRYLKLGSRPRCRLGPPLFHYRPLQFFVVGHTTKSSLGLALQLGFHALLRTGELLQLQAKDCTVQQDHIHLFLGQTKTSFEMQMSILSIFAFINSHCCSVLGRIRCARMPT